MKPLVRSIAVVLSKITFSYYCNVFLLHCWCKVNSQKLFCQLFIKKTSALIAKEIMVAESFIIALCQVFESETAANKRPFQESPLEQHIYFSIRRTAWCWNHKLLRLNDTVVNAGTRRTFYEYSFKTFNNLDVIKIAVSLTVHFTDFPKCFARRGGLQLLFSRLNTTLEKAYSHIVGSNMKEKWTGPPFRALFSQTGARLIFLQCLQ